MAAHTLSTPGATTSALPPAENRTLGLDTMTTLLSPEEAAAAAVASAPSVLDLGRQLSALTIAADAYDPVNMPRWINVDDSEAVRVMRLKSDEAREILAVREEAIRMLITTQPSKSMPDVAVQMQEICVLSSRLASSEHTAFQVGVIADQIERMALSMLPIVAAAADLNLKDMDWCGSDYRRGVIVESVGVAS